MACYFFVVVEGCYHGRLVYVLLQKKMRQNGIGLLQNLMPVDCKRVVMEKERAEGLAFFRKRPHRLTQKGIVLSKNSQFLIVGQVHLIASFLHAESFFLVKAYSIAEPFERGLCGFVLDIFKFVKQSGGKAQM